jgi:hypothetical protein
MYSLPESLVQHVRNYHSKNDYHQSAEAAARTLLRYQMRMLTNVRVDSMFGLLKTEASMFSKQLDGIDLSVGTDRFDYVRGHFGFVIHILSTL